MKKLFMGSIVLTMFSIAIILFQLSCKKDVNAQTSGGTTSLKQLNKIIYQTITSGYSAIWTANYDGTNQTKINIIMPSAIGDHIGDPKLSPDGQTVFIDAWDSTSNQYYIYTCSITGGNVQQIVGPSQSITINGAY
jgi:hypothetical protein